jgi:hypothetical protein
VRTEEALMVSVRRLLRCASNTGKGNKGNVSKRACVNKQLGLAIFDALTRS